MGDNQPQTLDQPTNPIAPFRIFLSLLVDAHDVWVDHLQALLPPPLSLSAGSGTCKAPETARCRNCRFSKVFIQIATWRAGRGDPERPVENLAAILRTPTTHRTRLDHERCQEHPLLIRDQTSNHDRSPQRAALRQRLVDSGTLFGNGVQGKQVQNRWVHAVVLNHRLQVAGLEGAKAITKLGEDIGHVMSVIG